VRQSGDEWRLFRSSVIESSQDAPRLFGYEQILFDSAELAELFARITALSLPIGPAICGYAGADGTTYQLALFGALYSECRFQWWSEAPPQW
jgi:hypothetical protein